MSPELSNGGGGSGDGDGDGGGGGGGGDIGGCDQAEWEELSRAQRSSHFVCKSRAEGLARCQIVGATGRHCLEFFNGLHRIPNGEFAGFYDSADVEDFARTAEDGLDVRNVNAVERLRMESRYVIRGRVVENQNAMIYEARGAREGSEELWAQLRWLADGRAYGDDDDDSGDDDDGHS